MDSTMIPLPDEHSKQYWAAANRGELLIQQCAHCLRFQFYPRRHCVHCMTPDPQWVTASGLGTIYSFTIVRRTPNAAFRAKTPYVYALVDLEEGVRMTTAVVNTAPELVRCGQQVRATYVPVTDAVSLPCFEPFSPTTPKAHR